PILQLCCGVLVFHEPMPPARLTGFALVWLALIIFTADAVRQARRTRRLRLAAAVPPSAAVATS
ncbi:EamA family transporter RarD, partial [Escherichia coli]|nr:EamA family transporter RarD [Escherichia coli]